jgi:hypothetical protein
MASPVVAPVVLEPFGPVTATAMSCDAPGGREGSGVKAPAAPSATPSASICCPTFAKRSLGSLAHDRANHASMP